jgi:N-acyl-D-amino-acid deacylase
VYDILIKNGKVFDGTGTPWTWANVAIEGGKIVAVGPLKGAKAKQVIDAEGKAVSPGFIDIHSHSDCVFLVNPKADSKVKQGVTLEIAGNCGSSVAPLTEKTKKRAELELEDGVPLTWTTFGEYLDAMQKASPTINWACLVGHGTIRSGVMDFDRRPPTKTELTAMKKLLAQAMDDGAFGMSSGLIYPPSSYADTAELVELAKVLHDKHGLYFTHMRNEADGLLESVNEAITVGREADVPVQIAHHKAVGEPNWGTVKKSLAMIDEARKSGVDVTADQYPYIASSTGLTSIIPGWAHEGGRPALLARLKDPATRLRLRDEVQKNYTGGGWGRIRVARVNTPENKKYEGMDIEAIAKLRGQEPVDAAFDLLIEENCDVGQIKFGMCEEDVKTVMQHPYIMPGSDGSSLATTGVLSKGKPHPRNYGTFVRVLGKYVREDKVLRLEEAIRKMTSLPAWRLGITDRGILRPCMWADIAIFDPETVIDVSDFTDPHRYPVGVSHVIVNGQLVVKNGEHTGKTPGMVLRRGK